MNKYKTLQNVLAHQLQKLLYAERKISEDLKGCCRQVSSHELRTVATEYIDNAYNVILKLQRIFSYLMVEPEARKNEVIKRLIDEMQHLATQVDSDDLKDILFIACLKNINAYKLSCLQTNYVMAAELELDNVAELLQQVMYWETGTKNQLERLSIHEFNKLHNTTSFD